MIRLSSTQQTEKVRAAVAQASLPGAGSDPYVVRLGLTIGPDDASDKIEEAEWGQSAVPITLDATLTGSLPDRLKEAPGTLIAEVDGTRIHQMVGHKAATIPNDEAYREDYMTSSAGSLLSGDDAIKLGSATDYYSEPAHRIAYDAVKRLPYDRSKIDVRPVAGVRLTFAASTETPGFLAHEATGDVLSRLSDEGAVGYDYRDTSNNGFVAWIPEALARIPEGEFALKSYLSSAMPDWLLQRPQPPTVRYHSVRVYGTDEAGNVTWEVIQEIPYPEGTTPPHRGRTLDLPFEDASEDFSSNARSYAVKRALEEARATHTGEVLLPCFDPLVERGDPFRVDETHRDHDGLWHIRWGMQIDAYKHLFATSSGAEEGGVLSTQVAFRATILDKNRVEVPAFVGPLAHARRSSVATPPEPYSFTGASLRFDDSLPWIKRSGDDLILYDNAPPNFAVSGDELIVTGA